jgi:hypothetical protein
MQSCTSTVIEPLEWNILGRRELYSVPAFGKSYAALKYKISLSFFCLLYFAIPKNGWSKNSCVNSLPRAAAVESSGQVVMWRDDVTYKEGGRQKHYYFRLHESWNYLAI